MNASVVAGSVDCLTNPATPPAPSPARWSQTDPMPSLRDLLDRRTPDWMKNANCRGVDPDLFFPDRGDTLTLRNAKAVCHGCSSIKPCLEWALQRGEPGVYGGTSQKERRAIRRRRAAA